MLPDAVVSMQSTPRSESYGIYKKARAANNPPTTLAIEPVRVEAEPVATAGEVEAGAPEPVPVGVAVVKRVLFPDPDPDPESPPEIPVAVDPAEVAATVPAEPSTAGLVGERPPPDETIPPPVIATEADEMALDAEAEAEAEADPEADAVDDGEALELETPLQERSKRGVLLKGDPGAIPKLGLGEALLSVSSRVYHQVLTTSNLGHPTCCQYFWALLVLATARFSVFPDAGHPVSVIQTGLPPTAVTVLSTASLKRAAPFSIPLD